METPRIASTARGLRHVFIRDLCLLASIGVHRHEHAAKQRIRINIDLGVEDDGARALSRPAVGRQDGGRQEGGRDELARVVDYEKLAADTRALVAGGHVRLVETLAERIAEQCLTDPRVHLARIRVEKLDVFADTASVGVEIERQRTDLSTH